MDYRHTHVYTYFCVNYSWKYTEKKKRPGTWRDNWVGKGIQE